MNNAQKRSNFSPPREAPGFDAARAGENNVALDKKVVPML